MDVSLISGLGHAARTLNRCATAAKVVAAAGGPVPDQIERVVGLGIACDWLSWAQSLKFISYSDRGHSKSKKKYCVQELTRFTFMWTAANALFARSSIIGLLDPAAGSKKGELDRFRVLFQHCGLARNDAATFEATLHKLLASEMEVKHFPWASANSTPTTLEVIYFKYTVASQQSFGVGKKLHRAATTKNYSGLDLPTLIYATRNWNIHGVLISSSFRGPVKKFNLWIDTVNSALAKVLEGAALALQNVI
jgi:hypothetical protein